MTKVITYGTYDLLHEGHIRLLERAKKLGDYLIVGVTADDFDKSRGKINVQQTLAQRIENIRQTGLADEIIVEEYEGQKIDDIVKYDVDIFTVGDDWKGKFDYLNEYCKVVYLERTEGVSSTDLRSLNHSLKLGLVGDSSYLNKVEKESHYVNGLEISAIYTNSISSLSRSMQYIPVITNDYKTLLDHCEAVFIHSVPEKHYEQVREALMSGKHVLCESPVALDPEQCRQLFDLAQEKGLVLVDALRTAYSTAFSRLLLLLKGGKIGRVISVDAACTSLEVKNKPLWNSITAWGPTALLPVFALLSTDYVQDEIVSMLDKDNPNLDWFSRISFVYPNAVATVKVGYGVKTEGELIISGTKGYAYVPAPWWKTDYFELRFEDASRNKRFFYQLDGEGLRNELSDFIKAINGQKINSVLTPKISEAICNIMQQFYTKDPDCFKNI